MKWLLLLLLLLLLQLLYFSFSFSYSFSFLEFIKCVCGLRCVVEQSSVLFRMYECGKEVVRE